MNEGNAATGRLAVGALLLVLAGCAAAPAPDVRAPAPDALAALNQSFRERYREARAAAIAAADPVLVVQFDDLHLIRAGKTVTERFTPPIYHEYKAVAHVPLALYAMLWRESDRPLDAPLLDRLRAYRALLEAAASDIAARPGWGAEQRALHRRIVVVSLALIDDVLAHGTIPQRQLAAYARATRHLVLASADAAARAQLDGLHALATRWRRDIGAEAWSRVNVVVLGPKQARPGNVQYAYFRRALGRGAEGRRLWYAEGVFDKDRGVELLGTILFDRGASLAFFGDPARLERDLLADAAAAHLDRLFTKRR